MGTVAFLTEEARLQRTSMVALVALVAVACGGGADAPDDVGAVSPTAAAPTDDTADDGTGGAVATATPTDLSTAAPDDPGPASTAPPPTGAPAPDPAPTEDTEPAPLPPGPEGIQPMAVGTYTYDTQGTSEVTGQGQRQYPPVTTAEARAPEGGRQVLVRDLRDADGRGSVTESTLIYADDGVHLARLLVTTVIGGGITDEREWNLDPAPLVAPNDVATGDRLSFTMDNGDTRADVVTEVLGEETLVIGGAEAEVVRVRTTTTLSGDVTGTQTTLSWIRRADFLTVRENHTSDVQSGPIRAQSQYTSQLQSLTPR